MTKSEYLAKLDKYLKKLPKEDYQEAMDYFREYFDEAGPENEEEVIAELGTPKEAAHDIISRLLDEKIVEDEKTPKNRAVIFWIAILAILASPVALPLIFLLLMIIVAIVAVVVSILVAVIALVLDFSFLVELYSLTAGLISTFLTQAQLLDLV